jgi:hypothetical protein
MVSWFQLVTRFDSAIVTNEIDHPMRHFIKSAKASLQKGGFFCAPRNIKATPLFHSRKTGEFIALDSKLDRHPRIIIKRKRELIKKAIKSLAVAAFVPNR